MRIALVPLHAADEVEALVTDLYLDSLLGQVERSRSAAARTADGVPAPHEAASGDAEFDAALLHAARVLRGSLLRAHPSFRFEERLAAQLADLASPTARHPSASRSGELIPFPAAAPRPGDPLLTAILDGRLDPADDLAVERAAGHSPARPLLVGGAITSAAISLVGVAWVAWRASRPGGASATRSARRVGATPAVPSPRLAELADYAAGLPGGRA